MFVDTDADRQASVPRPVSQAGIIGKPVDTPCIKPLKDSRPEIKTKLKSLGTCICNNGVSAQTLRRGPC